MRISKISEPLLRDTLLHVAGNITHAAAALEISKVHALRMTLRYGLRDFARELRTATGGKATGRPLTVFADY